MSTNDEIYIRDFTLPLVEIESAGRMADACGTCFLIGSRGFALTAAHVLDQMKPELACALLVRDGQWQAVEIVGHDTHPVQDVAVIKLASEHLKVQQPIAHISGQRRQSSCQVEAWGYPKHVTIEPQKEGPEVSFRPDLIYFSGYVRRRIPRELPISIDRGNSFYELSFVAGEACSGGPLIVRRAGHWDVAGIYIGENTRTRLFAVGYAATGDSFADWAPRLWANPFETRHQLQASARIFWLGERAKLCTRRQSISTSNPNHLLSPQIHTPNLVFGAPNP